MTVEGERIGWEPEHPVLSPQSPLDQTRNAAAAPQPMESRPEAGQKENEPPGSATPLRPGKAPSGFPPQTSSGSADPRGEHPRSAESRPGASQPGPGRGWGVWGTGESLSMVPAENALPLAPATRSVCQGLWARDLPALAPAAVRRPRSWSSPGQGQLRNRCRFSGMP